MTRDKRHYKRVIQKLPPTRIMGYEVTLYVLNVESLADKWKEVAHNDTETKLGAKWWARRMARKLTKAAKATGEFDKEEGYFSA